MTKFQKIFLRGLIVTLPITLTISVLLWVISQLENLISPLFIKLVGPEHYWPGIGLLIALTLIMIIGIAVDNYLTSKIFKLMISYFERLPLIKTIYSPIKDLFSLIGGSDGTHKKMQRVVTYQMNNDIKMIGLVTRDMFTDLDLEDFDQDQLVSVYFPSSFMFGGYTMLVKKNSLTEINLPVDKALKLAITGWIHIEKNHKGKSHDV